MPLVPTTPADRLRDTFACDGGCGRDLRTAAARPVSIVATGCGGRSGSRATLRFCRECTAVNEKLWSACLRLRAGRRTDEAEGGG